MIDSKTMGHKPLANALPPTPEELVASVESGIAECERVIAERQSSIATHRREIVTLRGRIKELKRMLPRKPRAKKAAVEATSDNAAPPRSRSETTTG